MQWYTLLIHLGADEPTESMIKASSEDEAFQKAQERWGDVFIEVV